MPEPESIIWFQSLFLLLILTMLLAVMLKQASEYRRLREMGQRRRIVSVEECGGKLSERPFKEGDYVGKVVGDCGEGNVKRIVAIYAVEEGQYQGRESSK